MRYVRTTILQRHDRGAALVTALLILTIMTLLALGASQLRHSQDNASRTMQQRDLALQSAEAALRGAERLLGRADATIDDSCTTPRCRIYAPGQIGDVSRQSAQWWEKHGWAYSVDDAWIPATAGNSAAAAMFVVEHLDHVPDSLAASSTGPSPANAFCRITAIARPDEHVPPVVLQSVHMRPVN